jgi:hypothetical protein
MKKVFILFASITLLACSGPEEVEENEETLADVFNELNEELTEIADESQKLAWTLQTDSVFCEIEIPNRMKEMPKLNAVASIKYGEVIKEDEQVFENYILVLPETFEEIESYELKVELNCKNYHEICKEKLLEGLTDVEMIEESEEPIDLNGSQAIISKLKGNKKINEELTISIYYELAVVQGERGFYQVLSWTLVDQIDRYSDDMDRMTQSFKELKN